MLMRIPVLTQSIGLKLALLVLCSSCSLNNTTPSPNTKKGQLYYEQGTQDLLDQNYTRALKHLQLAASLLSSNSPLENNLGMAYFFRNDWANALKHLEKAVSLDEKNSDARNNYASVLVRQNRLNDAEREYLIILKDLTYEHQYRTYNSLAQISLRKKNSSEALVYLEKSLNEKNNFCPSHLLKGNILFDLNQLEEALKAYKIGEKGQCYEMPEFVYYQAITLRKMGQFQKAIRKYQLFLERFPKAEQVKLAKMELDELQKKHPSSSPKVNDPDESLLEELQTKSSSLLPQGAANQQESTNDGEWVSNVNPLHKKE